MLIAATRRSFYIDEKARKIQELSIVLALKILHPPLNALSCQALVSSSPARPRVESQSAGRPSVSRYTKTNTRTHTLTASSSSKLWQDVSRDEGEDERHHGI
ncbi:Hypothetical protein SMAX5B_002435 [Scophthalmus maximus]|uniref:Uncharacterized protein n=1 Tax=Scophthalmus maximus TaxID=52904 RepID=A0A2U9AVQ9_SCOMX|nr:Hypothetical protein SMAX5B_002435 [Scophthalmus maximus]